MTIREYWGRRFSIVIYLIILSLVLFLAVGGGLLAADWLGVALLSFLASLFIWAAISCPRCSGKLDTPAAMTWPHSPNHWKHGINFCPIFGAPVTGFAKKGWGHCPKCKGYLFDSGGRWGPLPVVALPPPTDYCRHCSISFDVEISEAKLRH